MTFSDWLHGLFGPRPLEESYDAGRYHAAAALANAADYERAANSLWARTHKQETLWGDSPYYQGIADVLTEQGLTRPYTQQAWRTYET